MLIYIGIFFAKIIEYFLDAYRMILTLKGEKIFNLVVCFIQSLLGILVLGSVVSDITSDYFKVVVYVLGGIAGNYIGLLIGEKMAIGRNLLTIVLDEDDGISMAKKIRQMGHAVTLIDGYGKDKKKKVLLIAIDQKFKNEVLNRISKECKNVLVLNEKVDTVGGFY